jgi:predicted ATP-grasp superfamily ATP-dependent carboligase
MNTLRTSVVVAGAEHPQSLPIIRGLGRAGLHVIAGGRNSDSIGFHSRYATDSFCYPSPNEDHSGFVNEIIGAAHRAGADLVVPGSPIAFTALIEARDAIERRVRLAAPPATSLMYALDITRTFALAAELGVTAPRWCIGPSVPDILRGAEKLSAPFVVRQRGRSRAFQLPDWTGLATSVRVAHDLDDLRRTLEPLWDHAGALVVHEATQGIGRSVTGVWYRGQPISLVAYERERQWLRLGGASVVRRTIRLDDALASTVTRLFERAAWHGVGTAEFAYDRRADRYVLTGMSGRFQTAAALCLAAGINLPLHAVAAHLGNPQPERARYRVGVRSRWLRGDAHATWDALVPRRSGPVVAAAVKSRAVWRFIRDFGRRMYYDEFAVDDAMPAVVTVRSLTAQTARAVGRMCMALFRMIVGRPDAPGPARRRNASATRAEQRV